MCWINVGCADGVVLVAAIGRPGHRSGGTSGAVPRAVPSPRAPLRRYLRWLSARSQDRARCKSNLSLYHLLVDGGPTWVKVAYVILRFFRVIPFKCLAISTGALYSTARATCVESSRTIQKLPRRARSYLLGQVPAGIYRTFMHDLRQILIFTAELHALLSLNWPVILARRLATGATRARHACHRIVNATLHTAIIVHYFVSLNWLTIAWRRISNSLRWAYARRVRRRSRPRHA